MFQRLPASSSSDPQLNPEPSPMSPGGDIASSALERAFDLLGATGTIAIGATHAQLDEPLKQACIALARQGEHLALLIADNHFEADAFARVVDSARLKVARAETPYQVRYLVGRLALTRTSYSIVVVIGLLETFYDEQLKDNVAQTVLTDILQQLNELARTLRVLIVMTPAPKPTRPFLKAQVIQGTEHYLELPRLAPAQPLQNGRLF